MDLWDHHINLFNQENTPYAEAWHISDLWVQAEAAQSVVDSTIVTFAISCIMNLRINWSISELNTQVNPTTCLGDTDCWIQQVTAPTLVVTCWIQQFYCILHSSRTGGLRPPVQVEVKMHTECWIQQL